MSSIMRFDEWQDSNGNPVLNGTGLAIPSSSLPTGSILQVVQTVKTNVFTRAAAASFEDITGFAASITPSSTSNKILVIVTLNGRHDETGGVTAKLIRNSTDIFIGDSAASHIQGTSGGYQAALNTSVLGFNYLDSPSSTSSTTYKVALRSQGATFQVNNVAKISGGFTYGDQARTASSIILMEVAG
jgi:hypothetical protein